METVQVIGMPQSNYVWAVRIALAEKGVVHEVVPAPPHSPEVNAVHPLGKIPVLRHGAVALGESRAIIDYVEREFDGPHLTPSDADAARRSDQWTSIITTSIEPLLIRRYVFAYLFPAGANGSPDRLTIDTILPEVEGVLDVLEGALAAGELGGERFDRADTYLTPILFYVRSTPEGGPLLAARPRLSAYLEQMLARPSVRATLPHPLPKH